MSAFSITTGTGIREVSFDTAGGTQDFLMYSNYGSWKLVPTYEEDLEWLSFWPTEGVGDARFSAMVAKNKTAYQRHGTLNVVVDGEPVATIRFSQTGRRADADGQRQGVG